MHVVFALARIYPYWAFPAALVLGELGFHFRRKKSPLQGYFWASAAVLLVGMVAWFVFRGDLHSDQWIKSVVD